MRLIDADALDAELGVSDMDIYVRECLEDAPSVCPLEWIPVSKDTPKTSANVIISHKDGVALGWYDGKHWIKDGYSCETVKAWMPLPKAYEVTE